MADQNLSHDAPAPIDEKAPRFDDDYSKKLLEGLNLEDSYSDEGISLEDLPKFITVDLSELSKDFQCPICLGMIRKTKTVMECLHRFCGECIEKVMRMGNNECPVCHTHCAGCRSLRDDLNYDALIAVIFKDMDDVQIAALFKDTDKYEAEETQDLQNLTSDDRASKQNDPHTQL